MGVSDDFEVARRALSESRAVHRDARYFDLPAALEELQAWLVDDHHVGNTHAVHWASLVDDVVRALQECGPLLRAAVVSRSPHAIEELQACRSILKRGGTPPDASLRRRIDNVVHRLHSAQSTGETLVAAFRDLTSARDWETAQGAARHLVALSELAGHDSTWFPSRLEGILADGPMSISAERGTKPPEDPHGSAGLSPSDRVELVESILREPASASQVVVWLKFANASLGSPPTLKIGNEVHLFSDDWLRASLLEGGEQLAAIAPEAIDEHKAFELRLFAGTPGASGDDEDEASHERAACVYMRIVQPESTATHALAVARLTADVLSGLVCLYGAPARLWQLEDSFVCLAEDGTGGASFAPPHPSGLNVDEALSLENDHSGVTLANQAERLGSHLPVRDPAIAQAGTLLSWLRQARLTEAPPRLLLCDRVVEQVSGWAGFASPRQFTNEFLKLSWSYRSARRAVSDAAFAAKIDLHHSNLNSVIETFADDAAGFDGTINLQRFLEVADVVAKQVGDLSHACDKLRRLTAHLSSPRASLAWLSAFAEDFERLEARRRRTRNALVHGGPLPARTVDAIADFAESLAVNALGASIEGRLADRDLIDHFLERRAALENVERRLRNGEPLSQALFWGND